MAYLNRRRGWWPWEFPWGLRGVPEALREVPRGLGGSRFLVALEEGPWGVYSGGEAGKI